MRGGREAQSGEVIVGVDPDPANADTIHDWCVGRWDATHPYSAGGAHGQLHDRGRSGAGAAPPSLLPFGSAGAEVRRRSLGHRPAPRGNTLLVKQAASLFDARSSRTERPGVSKIKPPAAGGAKNASLLTQLADRPSSSRSRLSNHDVASSTGTAELAGGSMRRNHAVPSLHHEALASPRQSSQPRALTRRPARNGRPPDTRWHGGSLDSAALDRPHERSYVNASLAERWRAVTDRRQGLRCAARCARPCRAVLDCTGPGARLCSQEGLIGGLGVQVADHAAVDDVGEVTLERSAGFLLGVPAGANHSPLLIDSFVEG